MKKVCSIFGLILLLLSCSKPKSDNNRYNVENIINMDNIVNLNFNELIEDNKFIKLETNADNKISQIIKIEFTKDLIFIADRIQQSIFVFSYPNGKYLNSIDAFGSGPNEYSRIDDFCVNENERVIEILDTNLKRINRYSYDGNFVSSKSIPFGGAIEFNYIENFAVFAKNIGEGSAELPYKIVILDSDYQIYNKFLKIEKPAGVTVGVSNLLKSYGSFALYLPNYSPILYQLDKNGIKAKYKFDFGDDWIDDKTIYEDHENGMDFLNKINNKGFVSFLNTTLGNQFLSINYYKDKKNISCLYDTKKNILYNISNFENGICQSNRFDYFKDDYFISIKQPFRLLKSYNDGIFEDEKFPAGFFSSMNDYDNPILMLTKFKSPKS